MTAARKQPADERRMRILIRQVAELDAFAAGGAASGEAAPGGARPAAFGSRRAGWLSACAAAAAVVLLALLPTGDRPTEARDAVFVELDHEPSVARIGAQRIDTFHSCAAEDAYALVLFRAWEPECACLTWGFYEFEDRSGVVRLEAGETLDIPRDVSDDPPIDQCIIVAVARQREVLPRDSGETERLLDCLYQITSDDNPDDASVCYAHLVAGCLPDAVTLVTEEFLVH